MSVKDQHKGPIDEPNFFATLCTRSLFFCNQSHKFSMGLRSGEYSGALTKRQYQHFQKKDDANLCVIYSELRKKMLPKSLRTTQGCGVGVGVVESESEQLNPVSESWKTSPTPTPGLSTFRQKKHIWQKTLWPKNTYMVKDILAKKNTYMVKNIIGSIKLYNSINVFLY